jgi:hypothetical protein
MNERRDAVAAGIALLPVGDLRRLVMSMYDDISSAESCGCSSLEALEFVLVSLKSVGIVLRKLDNR